MAFIFRVSQEVGLGISSALICRKTQEKQCTMTLVYQKHLNTSAADTLAVIIEHCMKFHKEQCEKQKNSSNI